MIRKYKIVEDNTIKGLFYIYEYWNCIFGWIRIRNPEYKYIDLCFYSRREAVKYLVELVKKEKIDRRLKLEL